MSMRGEFCRVLDKYKSGQWDRDRAAAQLEKYVKKQLSEIPEITDEMIAVADKWLLPTYRKKK